MLTVVSILTSFDELNFSLIGGIGSLGGVVPQVPRAKFRKGPRAILNAHTILTSDPLPKLKLGNYGDGLQNHPAYYSMIHVAKNVPVI